MGVVEDARHLSFANRVLIGLGFTGRNIHLTPAPKGKGSAYSRVLKEYEPLVRAFRRRQRSKRPNSGILVVIDADECKVEERARQLDEGLVAARLDSRGERESIAIWVPRRNIETWLVHLCGGSATEEENVKTPGLRVDIPRAAKAFVNLFHDQKQMHKDADTLPSIVSALEETRRIRH